MSEVIRFIPKSERERASLIREARARYENIFPSIDAIGEQPNVSPAGHRVSGAGAYRSDGASRS
jgi:hypothetical protein